jgi:hypothetical protein
LQRDTLMPDWSHVAPPHRTQRFPFAALALATVSLSPGCGAHAPPSDEMRKGEEITAALLFVEGQDEEGGMIGRGLLSDTAVVAFFRDHVAFAKASAMLEYLTPNGRIDGAGGRLRLDGSETGIPVEFRDTVAFVPVQPLADRFRAYAQIEESPGRMVTLWRHDILCRYARDADRRAEVFLGSAEQGLLRHCRPPIQAEVRRWATALPNELWAASLTLREPLDSANAMGLLERYRAAPYAAYGVAAGLQLIVRVAPDSASADVLGRLRAAGIEALERALCGLPGAFEGRRGTVVRRHRRGADRFRGERYMLASALAARRELPRLRAGTSNIVGVDVVANVFELRRLATDPRIQRFESATKLNDTWILPGVDLSGGVPIPSDIAALDSGALFVRLDAEVLRLAAECPSRSRRTPP